MNLNVIRFIYVDVGAEGRVGDAGIWNRCDLKKDIVSKRVGFPNAERLPHSQDQVSIPFHIVGDSAFQLDMFLMKPYSQARIEKDVSKRIFNYRLSRARRCVENAFGILTHRFEVFRSPIRTSVETADKIVLACIALHNWLMTDRMMRETYCPVGLVDTEDNVTGVVASGHYHNDPPCKGLINITSQGSNRSTSTAQGMRDYISEYFVSDAGRRQWQDEMI